MDQNDEKPFVPQGGFYPPVGRICLDPDPADGGAAAVADAPADSAPDATPADDGPSDQLTADELSGLRSEAEGTPAPTPAQPGAVAQNKPIVSPAAPAAAAAVARADVQLPEEWSKYYGGNVKTVAQLDALVAKRIGEEQAQSTKFAGYAQQLFEQNKQMQAELARLKTAPAAQPAALGVQPNTPEALQADFDARYPKGRVHGFRDQVAAEAAAQENHELYRERWADANGVITQKRLDKILADRMKPLVDTEQQRAQRDQQSAQQAQFTEFDGRLRQSSLAIGVADPRFAAGVDGQPAGPLWQELEKVWRSPTGRRYEKFAQIAWANGDTSYNPFEELAMAIGQKAALSLETAKAAAGQKRLAQVGAAAASPRPGAAAPVAATSPMSVREELESLAAIARTNGEQVPPEQVASWIRILESNPD